MGGAAAVFFQAKLPFQCVVDRFDLLPNPAEVAVSVGLALAVRP
jgi:hypothetical protein